MLQILTHTPALFPQAPGHLPLTFTNDSNNWWPFTEQCIPVHTCLRLTVVCGHSLLTCLPQAYPSITKNLRKHPIPTGNVDTHIHTNANYTCNYLYVHEKLLWWLTTIQIYIERMTNHVLINKPALYFISIITSALRTQRFQKSRGVGGTPEEKYRKKTQWKKDYRFI